MADYGTRTARYDDPLFAAGRFPVGATPDPLQPANGNIMRTAGSDIVPYQQPPGTTRIGDVGQFPGSAPAPTTEATPAATTGSPGSPLNTLYGVSNDSFLTDDQRKLARQIQGKFDASLDQRDRELQRYSAPRLSSFAEDEALARAIAEARGLNYRAPVDAFGNPTGAGRGATGGGGGGGNGAAPRGAAALRDPTAPRTTTPGSSAAKWQSIMSGLASIAPLLFGKDAYGQFLNRGLLGTIKDKLFGPGASASVSDAQLENMVTNGGLPGGDGIVFNPITGAPMSSYGGNLTTPTGFETDPFESVYQGGNSAGLPDWVTSEGGAVGDFWGSGAWGDADPWAGWTPDSGGDILDLFGGV